MWAIARYDLHISSDDFYSLTPRKFDALIKRLERAQQHSDYMLAQIVSYGVNFSMCHPKDSVRPEDFMPGEWAKPQPKLHRTRMTRKVKDHVTLSIHEGFAALTKKRM